MGASNAGEVGRNHDY